MPRHINLFWVSVRCICKKGLFDLYRCSCCFHPLRMWATRCAPDGDDRRPNMVDSQRSFMLQHTQSKAMQCSRHLLPCMRCTARPFSGTVSGRLMCTTSIINSFCCTRTIGVAADFIFLDMLVENLSQLLRKRPQTFGRHGSPLMRTFSSFSSFLASTLHGA